MKRDDAENSLRCEHLAKKMIVYITYSNFVWDQSREKGPVMMFETVVAVRLIQKPLNSVSYTVLIFSWLN